MAVIKWADQTAVTTVKWLWKPFIPFGKVTLVEGNGGDGKTTMMLTIAAMLSQGVKPPALDNGSLYESESIEPLTTFFVTDEDSVGDMTLPRYIRAGGDRSRLAYSGELEHHMTLNEQELNEIIIETGARLLIIDPLQSFLPKGTNMGNMTQMRAIFSMLTKVAQTNDCAIVIIGHLNKNEGARDIHRGMGSVDISAAVRSILLVEADKKDRTKRYVRTIKSNYDESDYTPLQLVFDDNNRITIGDEKNNTITVRFNGGEPVRFNLNSNEFSQNDFFQEVTNADFRINYSRNNLLLQERFKMMDEAGCFQTDIAYLGTTNAAYYTYPVGSDGRPIIEQSETRTEPVQNQQSQINNRENTYVINGKYYRESDKGLFDENSNPITDESIRTSFYYNKIITEGGLTPAYTEPKSRNRYYIISNDANSPLVVKLDRKNNVTVATIEQSRQMIDRIREIKEKAARERAINEYDTTGVEPGTERIEANEALGVTEEDVLNMALGDAVAYRENPTGEQQPSQPSQEPVVTNGQADNKAPIEIGSKDTQERLRRVSGTFVGISRNAEFRDSFKIVIDAKPWGKELAGKNLAEIASILQSHGIETTNIKDAQAWLENIRDCK